MTSSRIKTRINIHMDNYGDHTRDILREVLDQNINTDVFIKTGKRKFPCHRLVLSFCSDFLKRILDEPDCACATRVIVMPEVSEDILEQILRFMYTGEIGVPEDRFQEFLDACNALQLKSMHNYSDYLRPEGVMLEENEGEPDDSQMDVQEALLETDDGLHKVQIIHDYDAEYQIVSDKGDEGSLEIEVINDMSTTSQDLGGGPPSIKRRRPAIKREKIKEEYDPASADQIKAALDDVIQNKISFQQAADMYKVSKTLLWRLAQNTPEYHLHRSASNNPELNQIIVDALKSGETLLSISKRYNVPVSTLHRRKSLLYEQGELPENVRIKQRNRGEDFGERLERAINDVYTLGISQTEASKKYRIPKTTIWRRLKKLSMNDPKYMHLLKKEDDMDQSGKSLEETYAFGPSVQEIIIGQQMMGEENMEDAQVKYIKICQDDEEDVREPGTMEAS